MLHHIAFDLGNVLLDVDWDKFYHEAAKHKNIYDDFGNIITNKVLKEIMEKKAGFDFIGLIRLSDEFKNVFGESAGKEISNIWNEIIKPNEIMFNFIKQLKYEGAKIAYLSNMGFDHLEVLNSKYPEFMDIAYVKHMSCEVGARKPTALFFQSFLLDNPEFSGCMYFDDLQENLSMACKYKFSTNHFDLDLFKSQLELRKELIKIKDKMYLGG